MTRFITENFYKEAENAADAHDEGEIIFVEGDGDLDLQDLIDQVSDEDPDEDISDMTVEEALTPMIDGDESLDSLSDELKDMGKDVTDFVEEHGDKKISDLVPGSSIHSADLDDKVEEKVTNYVDDGDLTKFMDYINESYPHKIPPHDGKSTLGCERAISFLEKLNSEISKGIREDSDNALDISRLEDVRVRIVKDVILLKEHLGKLKKKLKEAHEKKSNEAIIPWTSKTGKSLEYEQLIKEATTPNKMVIAVSPFERAIVGILINAHVSAGHPLDKVYDFLCEKYDLDDREKLSILQICMDSGFHIFKDRGTIGSKEDDKNKDGIDFITNYFA